MKNNLSITLLLILTNCIQGFSQSERGYSVVAEISKAKQINGHPYWTVKTTLTNKTRRTLYYFSSTCSEAGYYSVDTNALYVEVPKCDIDNQNVIEILPKSSRTVNLEVFSFKPLTASIPFRVYIFLYRAKDMNERIPVEKFGKGGTFISNIIKT